MNPVPKLTDEQRRENLRRAMDMRTRRAGLKMLMKLGGITVAEALEAEAAQNMRVYDFLTVLPGVGTHRAYRTMERIGISPTRRVRGLGCRQRREIVKEFDDVD